MVGNIIVAKTSIQLNTFQRDTRIMRRAAQVFFRNVRNICSNKAMFTRIHKIRFFLEWNISSSPFTSVKVFEFFFLRLFEMAGFTAVKSFLVLDTRVPLFLFFLDRSVWKTTKGSMENRRFGSRAVRGRRIRRIKVEGWASRWVWGLGRWY